MGYTHYWKFKEVPANKALFAEKQYQLALSDIGKLARYWNTAHKKDSDKDHYRLSGYTAHVKKDSYTGVHLNGKKHYGHEDFNLRPTISENNRFDFCKTARKPYDTVIVGALSILKHRLGNLIEVESDGQKSDWSDGTALAARITRLNIDNPIKEQ